MTDNAYNDVLDIIEENMYAAQDIVNGCNMYKITNDVIDTRAFQKCWIDDDGATLIISSSNKRMADYYGGFEYIDAEDYFVLGDYVFYSYDTPRIAEVIDRLLENSNEHICNEP